jgi:hypothetical protein
VCARHFLLFLSPDRSPTHAPVHERTRTRIPHVPSSGKWLGMGMDDNQHRQMQTMHMRRVQQKYAGTAKKATAFGKDLFVSLCLDLCSASCLYLPSFPYLSHTNILCLCLSLSVGLNPPPPHTTTHSLPLCVFDVRQSTRRAATAVQPSRPRRHLV